MSKGEYELRVDLEDFDGQIRYAKYDGFKIGNSASKYVLEAVDYSGDAGTTSCFLFEELLHVCQRLYKLL